MNRWSKTYPGCPLPSKEEWAAADRRSLAKMDSLGVLYDGNATVADLSAMPALRPETKRWRGA